MECSSIEDVWEREDVSLFFDSVSGLVRVLVVGSLAYIWLMSVLRWSGKRTLAQLFVVARTSVRVLWVPSLECNATMSVIPTNQLARGSAIAEGFNPSGPAPHPGSPSTQEEAS